jgi:hypothetical protein
VARRSALIAGLLLLVLAGHGLVLEWLSRQAQAEAGLRLMAAPMFTRLLEPQAPAPPPPSRKPPPRVNRISPGPVIAAVTPSLPAEGTATTDTQAPSPPPPRPIDTAGTDSASMPVPESDPSDTAAIAPPESAASSAVAAASAPTAPTAVAPSEPSTGTQTAAMVPSPAASAASAPGASAGVGSGWPADTRLNYRVSGFFRGELHGSARVQWQREEQRYQTRIDIDLGLVSLVMTSQGEVSPQGLAPQAYEEVRAGRRRTTVLRDKVVVLSDGSTVARPDGVQDTASQFVELSHRFSSGQLPLAVGQSVSFWMARPGGVDQWTYDIADREILQLPPFGAVEAFHLKPRPLANPRGNITAEMWFAPSLQYLPVRIRVTTGEAHLDLFVEKIEQR